MKDDTPLTEVANHIPADMAALLLTQPEEVQAATLQSVKYAILGVEEAGVQLDPVQYETVVRVFCAIIIPHMSEILRLRMSMQQAAQWIEGQVTSSE